MVQFLIWGSMLYLVIAVFALAIRLCQAENRAEAAEARAEVLASDLDTYKNAALSGERASTEDMREPCRN